MNKRFTKLEIILVGVILLIVAGFASKSQMLNTTPEINQSSSKEVGLCTRTTPYNNPPELMRAVSLVSERWNAPSKVPTKKGTGNCIHLIYKNHNEMEGAEGYFSFDKNSSPNDIRIYVDDTYKNYDDILTASLLQHEAIHVANYLKVLEGTSPPTCLDEEVSAFYSQIIFFTNLNQEEWKSITYKVAQNPHLNSAYELTNYLLLLNKEGDDKCANDNSSNCWEIYVKNQLKEWVSSNPYYQKQCGTN